MTDIRKHLPVILACVRQHHTRPDTATTIIPKLRQLLPASYGIGSGCLINALEQRSQPLDIIIYDTTVPSTIHDTGDTCYDFAQALAVIVLEHEVSTDRLNKLLSVIASVKTLSSITAQRSVQKPSHIIKRLRPLAILGCQSLQTPHTHDLEKLTLSLDKLLKQQPEHLRPDYLLLQNQQLSYSNPLLYGETFTPTNINITREPELKRINTCYVCKQQFTRTHFFYAHLCPRCGDLNYLKRSIPADLTGRLALVTGARVKIGYATALRLLRAGAHVIATTRFPHDAAQRYANEPDFTSWQDRLQIYGLDLRYLPVVEHFVAHLHATYPALDILINNAAQTIRRPLDYYAHLLPLEQAPLTTLPPEQQILLIRTHASLPLPALALLTQDADSRQSAPQQREQIDLSAHSILIDPPLPTTSILPMGRDTSLFPLDQYDEHQQQIDLRPQNSWRLAFDEIDLTEFLEVQTINTTAPYLLISRLCALLERSNFAQRFIINVSAVEGQFTQSKSGMHAHTNMAKAALNMLTHTVAPQLARTTIFMHSVDPGWVSQQAPTDPQTQRELQKLLPLDLIDASARICDPIFMSIIDGSTAYGQFYKDYQSTPW